MIRIFSGLQGTSIKPVRPVIAVILWLVLGTGSLSAEPYVYSVVDGDLVLIDLATGHVSAISANGELPYLSNLARGPNGELYGMATDNVARSDSLVRIDQRSGQGTIIGDSGTFRASGLSFDDLGRLWAVDDDRFYAMDLATGQATLARTLPFSASGLAMFGGQLYVFYRDADYMTHLSTIDPDSGDIQPVTAFADRLGYVTDADFDPQGVLWFRTVDQGPIQHTLIVEYFRLDDPSNVEPESLLQEFDTFGSPLSTADALVVAGFARPASIPVVSEWGLVLLALALGWLAVRHLPRRSSR